MVASLDDLMAQKLKTINQRVEVKDYLDIADMIQNGVDLYKGLRTAQKLFGNSFQPSITLETLTWFDGLNMSIFPVDKQNILIEETRKNRLDIQEQPVLLRSHYLTSDDIAQKLDPVLQREYNFAKLTAENKTIFNELIRLIPKQLSSNGTFQVRLLEDLLNKQDMGIIMQNPDPQKVAQEFASFEMKSSRKLSR